MSSTADIERQEKADVDWRELEGIAATHVCAECGGRLTVPYDPIQKKVVLRCGTNRSHTGYTAPDPTLTMLLSMKAPESEIQEYLKSKHTRREKGMGTDSKAVQQYQSTGVITVNQAIDIIRTTPGWSKAPDNVIKRAALVCQTYRLFPGIHVFLLKFEMRDGTESWTVAFGIKTNRLQASRQKAYKYIDGPRPASEKEARAHFLEEYNPELLYGICKLEGLDGSYAEGWGTWPKADKPYGTDKGNSKANMVEIRAERRALDRLVPGEIPSGIDTVDEQYVDALPAEARRIEQARIVDQDSGEIVGGQVITHPPPNPAAPLGVCPIHNVALIKGQYGVYCPTKVSDGKGGMKFCKGVQKGAPAAKQQPSMLGNNAQAAESKKEGDPDDGSN